MAKYLLDNELDEYVFKLIGISSHSKDYKLCWAVNKKLGFDFKRDKDDIELKNRQNKISIHSIYSYFDQENEIEFRLIKNKTLNGMLCPEENYADYFLHIIDDEELVNEDKILEKLKKINVVLTAFKIDITKLKSKENLMF